METRNSQRNTISLPLGLSETLAEPIALANNFIGKIENLTDLTLPTFEESKAPSSHRVPSHPPVRSQPDFRPAVRISNNIRHFESPNISSAQVLNPVHVNGRLRGYGTCYAASFENIRRYRDFYQLRKMLCLKFPGCNIPSLPPKQAMGNTHPHFVENRRKLLEIFLYKIVNIDYLLAAEELNIFLKGSPDYKLVMKHYSYPLFKTILQNYQATFTDTPTDDTPTSMKARLIEQENRIKYAFNLIKALDKSVFQIGNSYRCFKIDLSKMFILHQQFETMLFTHYEPSGRDVIKIESIRPTLTDSNPFSIFREWIETEKNEFLSMLESIRSRDRLQLAKNNLDHKLIDYYEIRGSKLKAFIHKLRYSSATSQIYNTEESIKTAIQELQTLESIILARQLNYEFPKFIEEREWNLREMLSKLGSVLDLESFKVRSIIVTSNNQGCAESDILILISCT